MKKGDRFYHKKWLADLSETVSGKPEPMLCQVTRVAQGRIYWREVYWRTGKLVGNSCHFGVGDVERFVGRVVDAVTP